MNLSKLGRKAARWFLTTATPLRIRVDFSRYLLLILILEEATYVMVVDINGVVTFINKNKTVDLKDSLPEITENTIEKDFSLEVVASDISMLCDSSEENVGYLATW